MTEFIEGFLGIWEMLAELWPGWDAESLGEVAGCISFGLTAAVFVRGLFWIGERRIDKRIERERVEREEEAA